MAHLPDRDVVTTEGRKLTLMNPAYMLREMMQDFGEMYGIRGRIVGIVYLNPDNKADDWEADAIRRFSSAETDEVMGISDLDDAPHLRLIKPMVMLESCQKCHGHLEFPNGSVRGAVGVSVPLAPYLQVEERSIKAIALSHGGVLLLGLTGIGVAGRRSTDRLMEKARAEEENRLAAHVFGNAVEAMLITDSDTNILRVNPAFVRLTGYDEAEAVGRRPNLLRSDHHDAAFYQELWHKLRIEGRWQGEILNRRKDGSVFVAWESIVAVTDRSGAPQYYIGSFGDITEQVETRKRIQHLAHFDTLTELPNRVLFHDRLEHALTLSQREGQRLALLFLDLDGFKRVNDTSGHRAGDILLAEVARRLMTCTRESDTIARLGGDEFAIILERIGSPVDVVLVAEKVLKAVAAPVALEGREVFVGASIGISIYPENGESSETLLMHADTAMYQSKAAGKGCFIFYSKDMTVRQETRLELENALRSAAEHQAFEVFYQPKYSLVDGRVAGFEALVRWRHPTHGLIPPNDFIPLAEEMRLITQIDLLVLEKACGVARACASRGHPVAMAVNLSSLDLHDGELPRKVAAILDRTGMPAAMLELEITESFVLDMGAKESAVLAELNMLGIALAIDDFGTGYSSLSYLKQLPVSTLKIDRAFIRDITRDDRDLMLVSTIIGLSHSLNLQVVAEGVEEQSQMDLLARQDCDMVQGFLISKPLPEDQVAAFLDAGTIPALVR
jgi:diguanylate cyclase (GGDEF)-like protein/PAS domain S-box-containing protein